MNKVGCAAMVAATAALAAFSAQAITISTNGAKKLCFPVGRNWEPANFPVAYKDFSGITWAGGNKFYVVQNNGFLTEMTVARDSNGNVNTLPTIVSRRTLVGAHDPEGIAYDPSTGNVWIASEEKSDGSTGATICEYDPNTGYPTYRAVEIPNIIKTKVRPNMSLESLTISGDGLTMWTANEEALNCDGGTAKDLASQWLGTICRLVKFTRSTVNDAWTFAGMWGYVCEPAVDDHPIRSSISDLVALPDGSLLVMERDMDAVYFGRVRVYQPNFANADDVSEMTELKRITGSQLNFRPVEKGTALIKISGDVEESSGFFDDYYYAPCYEGLCLGPRNPDGSLNMMLISDGGEKRTESVWFFSATVRTQPYVRSLKLSGLNVRTLSVNRPAPVGEPTIVGQNYRFLNNQRIVVDLLGDGVGEKPYTNRCDLVFASSWALPGHGKQGNGPHVEFNITKDDSLVWTVAHSPNIANTPIYAHDTFEEYAQGTYGSNVRYWSGGGEVVQQSYTPFQGSGKEILKRAAHTKVLDAADGATRAFPMSQMSNISNHRMDLMVEIHRATEALPDTPDGNPRIAIAADTDGTLKLWHRKGANGKLVATPVWSKIADTSFQNGDWVRVSVEVKNGSSMAFARVRINGKGNMPNNSDWRSVPGGYSSAALNPGSGNGPWFPLRTIDPVSCLSLVGTKVDDFMLATPAYMTTLDSSASIMVSPVAQSSGANGAAAAGGQAYTVATAVAAPAVATANADRPVAAPVITGFGIVPGGCPSIRFRGYAEGVGYRVVRSTSVDFKPANCEYPEGEITSVSGDEAVWEGAEPDDPSSGAKFYRVEAIAK